jgi:hypothetical protein
VIASCETWPSATCVAIVHHQAPTSHVRSASVQILAPTTLTEVKGILHKQTMTVSCAMATTFATRTHDSPSVACVSPSVPEQHASMTTFLEHLKLDEMPSRAKVLVGFPIAPAMQTIIVDCETIVNPQLAAII